MRNIRKSGITALTAAIALSLGAVPVALTVPSIVASEGEPTTLTPAATFSPAGKLVLTTDLANSATVTYAGKTQTYSASNCVLSTPTGSKLLSFAGEGMTKGSTVGGSPVGLLKGAFGVQDKGTGTSCGRVDQSASESLTVKLGPDVVGKVGPVLASSATLDLDLKGGAIVTAIASVTAADGTAGKELFRATAQSGTSATIPGAKLCTERSDSGADSGANDNCLWTIDAPSQVSYFNTLKLVADVGSIALSGGADYATQPDLNRTTFTLQESIDGTLCFGNSDTRIATSTAPLATVTRVNDAGSTTATGCLPYLFTNGASSARFLKDLTTNKQAQFVFEFDWTVDMSKTPTPTKGVTPSETSLIPRTVVDYEKGDLPVTISWCPDLVTVQVPIPGTDPVQTKAFKVVDNIAKNIAAPDQDSKQVDKQFACLISQDITTINGVSDKVVVHEEIYVYGDIRLTKA